MTTTCLGLRTQRGIRYQATAMTRQQHLLRRMAMISMTGSRCLLLISDMRQCQSSKGRSPTRPSILSTTQAQWRVRHRRCHRAKLDHAHRYCRRTDTTRTTLCSVHCKPPKMHGRNRHRLQAPAVYRRSDTTLHSARTTPTSALHACGSALLPRHVSTPLRLTPLTQ